MKATKWATIATVGSTCKITVYDNEVIALRNRADNEAVVNVEINLDPRIIGVELRKFEKWSIIGFLGLTGFSTLKEGLYSISPFSIIIGVFLGSYMFYLLDQVLHSEIIRKTK